MLLSDNLVKNTLLPAIFSLNNPVNCSNMEIVRSWREQKVMLKWRYPILVDEDFLYEDDRETMLTRLCEKLKKTRTELEALFAELQLY